MFLSKAESPSHQTTSKNQPTERSGWWVSIEDLQANDVWLVLQGTDMAFLRNAEYQLLDHQRVEGAPSLGCEFQRTKMVTVSEKCICAGYSNEYISLIPSK